MSYITLKRELEENFEFSNKKRKLRKFSLDFKLKLIQEAKLIFYISCEGRDTDVNTIIAVHAFHTESEGPVLACLLGLASLLNVRQGSGNQLKSQL